MEGLICRNCKVFFGCQEGLCSKCFRQIKSQVTEEKVAVCSLNKVIEEVKAVRQKEIEKPDRCFCCNKMLGPVNFRCKCLKFYCMRHRHPEEHKCEFDFVTDGAQRIKAGNPLVEAPKFNKLD